MTPKTLLNPVTRCIHISYRVPANAPDVVEVRCKWLRTQTNHWQPAMVTPLISETGLALASNEDRASWVSGLVTERRAAGLIRTVIFDPYPDAQSNGLVDVEFRIEIFAAGRDISTCTLRLTADNTDVVYLTDWSNVLQKDLLSTSLTDGKWMLSKTPSGTEKASRLQCKSGTSVPALTYPLNMKGNYAIFVSNDPEVGPISLRLSGDERSEKISSSAYEREKLWRWTRMDREHLVIKQAHYFSGYTASSLNYVKLVPLSRRTWDNLNAEYAGKHDKVFAAYFEPYSWAFYNDVKENYQHREPLTAYQEARVDLIDVGCGRFGAKSVFETRMADQLVYSTEGDPIDGEIPVTDNVGRMQQYTNTLRTELKYASELGMGAHAQFGATACYSGTALESEFSKTHPDWRRDGSLLLSVPGVRKYMLDVYREALKIGAPGVTIDFCRYPDGIDSDHDCTQFLSDLRKLADEFGRARGKHVTILVRFPSMGTRKWQCFDYKTWAREGLVDYLSPSNIQGVYQFFDIKPYREAVKGTRCKLMPEIDGSEWCPVPPGVLYWRAKQMYDGGADGVYIYQADGIINNTWLRRCMSRLRSSEAIGRWLRRDDEGRSHYSKGIYLMRPSDGRAYGFWDRAQIWVEGVDVHEMETYIDGKLVGRMSAPPYLLGTDGYESDKVVPPGEHKLLVRVKDRTGWLEQEFSIKGQ